MSSIQSEVSRHTQPGFLPQPPFSNLIARDVMTSRVETVPMDWSMGRLAAFLSDHNISGAPVVDESGQLCGMVSITDIVRQTGSGVLDTNGRSAHMNSHFAEDMADGRLSPEELRSFHESIEETVMVADIMTPVIFKVSSDMPLGEVADAMVKGHIHRVLVADGHSLKGIITSLDLLKMAIH